MSKHTPGPWKKNRYGDLIGGDGTHVAVANAGISLEMSYPHSDAAVANTHLLVASPDMYEALKSALAHVEALNNAIAGQNVEPETSQGWYAALARAEGRS